MRAIAGLRRRGADEGPPAFTMLTTEHNRQVVVLRSELWADWLYLTKPEAELLQPLPAGSLNAETVRQGSD
jgi:putative SOS response-associated peptidase YedK